MNALQFETDTLRLFGDLVSCRPRALKNFAELASGWDVSSLSRQIQEHEGLFVGRKDVKEGDGGYSHKDAEVILVRYGEVPADVATNEKSFKKMSDDLAAFNREPWKLFTELRPLVYRLMELVQATHLGGIGIVRLAPGAVIGSHYDTGKAVDFYQRFHIVVSGPENCWFICGEGDDEERVEMLTGSAWWFDSLKLHGVRNESNEPRISISIDLNSY